MKRKQNWIWVLIALLVVVICLMLLPRKAGASDGMPEGVTRFYDCNQVCYVWPDGSGDCYPCNFSLDCEVSTNGETPVPTETPDKPTPTDPPKPTPKPTKVKCNSGRGNGSEGDPDCDPGNSGSKNKGGD